jgi:cytochrome c peroxidase
MTPPIRILTLAALALAARAAAAQPLTPMEDLGRNLYFDTNLSEPAGQACASCHEPAFGFAEPDRSLPVSEGVIPGRFGTRNAPSASYAVFFPPFTLKSGIRGGQFWDGRAANLTEQAKGPFLNPVEMNNVSRAQVLGKVCTSAYATLFQAVCGPAACPAANVDATYQCMAASIAAFESTPLFFPFDSKFDFVQSGLAQFTPQEAAGWALFTGRGKCGHCHTAKAGGGAPVIFTDAGFHNIGVPSNSEFPFNLLGPGFVDLGLGGRPDIADPGQYGKFKTTHVRNVALTPPYMHNGVLKTLKQVVHFYNTRDVLPRCDASLGSLDPNFGVSCWPPPALAATMDSSFLGNLGLTAAEEDSLVAFLTTLTDGYTPP